jgi:hypothetical protein
MAHARRKFDEAESNDRTRAEYVLTEMQKLYAFERRAKEASLSSLGVLDLRSCSSSGAYIYLAYGNIRKKWTQPLQNWSLIVSQLSIWFEGRLKLTL